MSRCSGKTAPRGTSLLQKQSRTILCPAECVQRKTICSALQDGKHGSKSPEARSKSIAWCNKQRCNHRRTPLLQVWHQDPLWHRAEAFAFDATNDTWQDAVKLELDQLDEHDTFINKGKQAHGPNKFKQINCHFVFHRKQDLRHKARLVGGGHMTAPPRDSACSDVMSPGLWSETKQPSRRLSASKKV
jgi:hypothetical protein